MARTGYCEVGGPSVKTRWVRSKVRRGYGFVPLRNVSSVPADRPVATVRTRNWSGPGGGAADGKNAGTPGAATPSDSPSTVPGRASTTGEPGPGRPGDDLRPGLRRPRQGDREPVRPQRLPV